MCPRAPVARHSHAWKARTILSSLPYHDSSHQHESTALENLTHSLVGAALAELALPAGAATPQRRIFFISGIIAANLPDADLLYTRITPPPLGYLLHHRGHTHTLVGLVAQAMLIGGVSLLPIVRRQVGPLRTRLFVLIGLALLSHLVLDSWNSYGVHPFWPVSSRWYYGDAIYILEPWLWVVLGVAATLSTRDVRGRVLLGAAIALLAGAVAWFGMIGSVALIALAIVSAALVMIFRGWDPRRRAGVALAITALFVMAMFVLRERVRTVALRTIAPFVRSRIVDVILSPEPANPLCWSALTVARDVPTAQYVLARGTVAPVVLSGCDDGRRDAVVWDTPVRQSLQTLRELARTDCSVRAWLQFGRAPEIAEGAIGDLRYGGATRQNFSRMALRTDTRPGQCPPHLTHWGMPREDLMEPALD